MNDSTLVNGDCPPQSELSAWHDGQTVMDLREHIDLCPKCRAVVESYRRIDQAVQQAMHCPEGLADRIGMNCRKASDRSARPRPWRFPTLWYAAAGVAAAVVLGAFVTFNDTHGPMTMEIADSGRSPQDAPAPEDAPAADVDSTPAIDSPRREADRPSDRIHPSSLVMVDASGRTRSPASRAMIPPMVKHVWVVDNVGTCRQQFLGLLPQDCASHEVDSSDGTVQYRVMIPDNKLPALVNRFAEAGWALLSPGIPQPGQADEVFGVGIEVRYEVQLVGRVQQQ